MASRAIYGKPGGGKSYLSVAWLIGGELGEGELLNGTRVIITNERLVFDGIVEYLSEGGRPDIDVYSRIRLIEPEQVREFWRFRSVDPANDHPPISDEDIKKGIRPDKDHFASGGVYYLLSELHRHLNSREWRGTGPLVLDYISMHRHYGDDVVWVSQAPQNVDAQWRSVTQDWTEVRNFGKESLRGFRKGDYCEWTTYLEYSETGNAVVQERGTFKIQPNGIGKCYDTSDVGGKADKGKKKKGFHIYWVYGGILLLAAVVGLLFMFAPDLIASRFGGKAEEKEKADSPKPSPSYVTGGVAISPPASKPTPEPTPSLLHVVAVPLKYSAADVVLASFSSEGQGISGAEARLAVNGDNTGIIVSGHDIQQVIGLAEMVRRYDRECATIAVHCVIARRQIGESSRLGLFALWEDVAHGRGERSSLTDALEAVAIDLATGVSTMGAVWTARQALQAFVEFVSGDSRFQVLSNPTMVVSSGKTGTFSSGREIPVPTTVRDASGSQTSIEYKRAEFSFEVKPTLLESGRIILEIKQQNSDVIGTAVIAGSQIPTLSAQELKSSVTLTDRQLLYLGGIVVETTSDSNRGTPGLRKVPVLNWVFGHSEAVVDRSELFVMLCAEVYREDGPVRVERAIPVTDL